MRIGMAVTPLDQFLVDLDERKGKLPCCQEVSLIQTRVRKVIETILLEVRKENPGFETTLINSGSFYEGTKVGKPNEFDFFVQLDAFSYPEDVMFYELPCSTVWVRPTKSACKKIMPWIDLGNFEWKKNIKTPFSESFNRKAKDFEAYGMKVLAHEECVQSVEPLSRHGPAYTLLLEWNGRDVYEGLRISVDLTLAVKINSRPLKVDFEFESPSGRVMKSSLDSLPYFFAVGSYRDILTEVHPNFFAGQGEQLQRFGPNNFVLRCSQSCLEQLLFRQKFGPDSGQSKCLRLLKVLRDIMFPADIKRTGDFSNLDVDLALWIMCADVPFHKTNKLVSSYVLKTLVLFEWQQNPEDVLWTGCNLSQRLLNILRSLVDRLKSKKLTSFFYSDYNLFKTSLQDVHFMEAASIITILVDRLMSFKNLSKYKFEDYLTKITQDYEMMCRKKKLTSFLLNALFSKFLTFQSLPKVVEPLRNEGKGEVYDSYKRANSLNPTETRQTRKLTVESPGKIKFRDIYVQALLDQIAPDEVVVLTEIKAKNEAESISNAEKRFQNFARQRMAKRDNLPSYNLWTQEHWTVEESFYKLTSDEPKKLLKFLFNIFQEDIENYAMS